MIKFLNNNKYTVFALICIFLFGSIILFQFEQNKIYYYWDQFFPVNINQAFDSYLHLWHNETGFGSYDVGSLNVLIYILICKIIYFFTHNIYLTQRILFYLLFTFSGISCYLLLKQIFKINDFKQNIALLIPSFFYMVNTFSLIYIWRMNLNSTFLYAFLPLLFTGFYGILNKIDIKKNIFLLTIGFIFLLPAFSHPAYVSTTWFLLISYAVYLSITSKTFYPIKQFLYILSFWLVLNIWWIYPLLANTGTILELSGNKENSVENILFIFYTTSKYATLENVIRLLGEWHLYDFHFGINDFSWLKIYEKSNNLIYLATCFIPAIVISSIFINSGKQKNIKYFFLFLFILIFASITSFNNPLKEIYILLLEKFYILRVFRNIYEKTGILLVISTTFFIGFFLYNIAISKINKIIKYFLTLIIFVMLIAVIPMPFYINGFYPSGNDKIPSSQVRIPKIYELLAQYLQNISHEKILYFPFQNSPLQSSEISGDKYLGSDLLKNLTYLPIISTESGIKTNDNLAKIINYNIEYGKNLNLNNKILGILNISNVIEDPNILDLSRIQDGVQKKTNYKLTDNFIKIKNIENINIYKVNNKDVVSEVYIPQNPIYISNKFNENILSYLEYNNNVDGIYFDNFKKNSIDLPKNLPNATVLDIRDSKLIDNNTLRFFPDIKTEDYYDIKLLLNDNNSINNIFINNIKYNMNDYANSEINNIEIKNDSYIDVPISLSDTTIKDKSFEQNLWELIDTTPAAEGKSNFVYQKNEDSQDGEFSAQITSFNHRPAMRQKVEIKEGDYYQLKFYYKYLSGDKPKFIIEYLNPKTEIPISEEEFVLEKNNNWENIELKFRAKTDKIYLYFYADPGKEKFGSVLYDNIELREINTDIKNIILENVNQNNGKQKPKITYKKINPTKYEINISNAIDPYFINLMQSYNTNWKAYIVDDKKTEINNHYIANFYANSWYIDRRGDYKILIEFETQRIVNIIVYVLLSLVSIGVISYIIYKNEKKK